MAFCPVDGWEDVEVPEQDGVEFEDDEEFNRYMRTSWDELGGGFEPGEDDDSAVYDTGAAGEWRGDPSRRHRRLKNPGACEDLRMAVLNGCVDAVEEIITNSDDVHVDEVLRNGLTSLCIAADAAQAEVLKCLLSCGAKPDAGQSVFTGVYPPLVAACNSPCHDEGRVEQCVEALLAHGVDANKADGREMTALMYAGKHGRIAVVEKLLEKGVDLCRQDHIGWTALCHAAHGGQLEVVQRLLAADADPSVASHDGQLAEDLAFANSHSEVADYLTAVVAGDDPIISEDYVCPTKPVLEDSASDGKAVYHQYSDLESFLQQLSLSHFAQPMLDSGITLQQLLTMNEAELEQVGVTQVGARMRIIEEGTKSVLATWSKLPPDDDLKRREILQTNLTGMDAKLIAANLERHVSYTTTAFNFLQSQLPGVLTASCTQDEVSECLALVDEANEIAVKVAGTAADVEGTLSNLTTATQSSASLWLMGSVGVAAAAAAGAVTLYLLKERLR